MKQIAFLLVTIAVIAAKTATAQATDSITIGETLQTSNHFMSVYPISLSRPKIGACQILLADTLRVEDVRGDKVFVRLIKTKVARRVKHLDCTKGVLFIVSRNAYLDDLKHQYLAVKAIEAQTKTK